MNQKPTKETIIRTIILALALINQFLQIGGKSPIPVADETVQELVSVIFTVVASVWAWWKNNSFTGPAIIADEYLKELREKAKQAE